MSRGFDGVFYDYQSLLERIQRGWVPSSGTADREAYRTALDAEILLLDDLGHAVSASGSKTRWLRSSLIAVITRSP